MKANSGEFLFSVTHRLLETKLQLPQMLDKDFVLILPYTVLTENAEQAQNVQ